METKKKILIIEDEPDIARLMEFNLDQENFQVEIATTGEEGLKAAASSAPDLILLDLMLPGKDGLQVCSELRKLKGLQKIPIIMVTAKGEETDIVRGLEIGADDYVVKPFSTTVLVARVKSVLRRLSKKSKAPMMSVGPLEIHTGRFEVKLSGEKIDLTKSEFQILHYLARHPGWVFTRAQIVDAIRGKDYAVTERSVDVQIVGLRKKLGSYGDWIETVRGVGYRAKDASPGASPV